MKVALSCKDVGFRKVNSGIAGISASEREFFLFHTRTHKAQKKWKKVCEKKLNNDDADDVDAHLSQKNVQESVVSPPACSQGEGRPRSAHNGLSEGLRDSLSESTSLEAQKMKMAQKKGKKKRWIYFLARSPLEINYVKWVIRWLAWTLTNEVSLIYP